MMPAADARKAPRFLGSPPQAMTGNKRPTQDVEAMPMTPHVEKRFTATEATAVVLANDAPAGHDVPMWKR
jgi:hypothetical protein